MGVFTVWCAVVFQMKTLIMCMRLIGSYNLEQYTQTHVV